MRVTIKVRSVGQAFACCADVVDARGRVLATTRDFPYGARHIAYAAAEALAAEHGWAVEGGE